MGLLMVKTFKDMMHVDTHCRYVFMYPAAKYLEKNSVFFLIYKMPEKGHQSAPEKSWKRVNAITNRCINCIWMKIFLSFKAVHNVKQMLLHRPLNFQVEQERSSQFALPTQIMQDFYITPMKACQLFYLRSLRIFSWLCLFLFFIIYKNSCQAKEDW